MRLNHVYILIGSNFEPQRNVLRALETLKQWFNVLAVSPIYESPPVGGAEGDPSYWNMAVHVETYTILMLLYRKLRTIEHQLGRQRFDLEGERLKTVTVDLDILLFNNEVNRSVIEPLPHPDLERAYAAVPLADIAPQLPHPVTGETISEIAARLREGAGLRQLFPTPRLESGPVAALPEAASQTETPSPTIADTVLPGDIPQMLETQSPAPTLESLVTLPDAASDLQPPAVPVERLPSAPAKKSKGKKTADTDSAPATPPKSKSRTKKKV
jgi:2-amino-4-hydroxy-6-hydroxymethyldihydropteridine diphosphokinase